MKNVNDEIMTPATLAAEIEAATDRNDHTGAVCMLADFVGGKFPKLAAAIKAIHDAEGCMPYEVGHYRSQIKAEMFYIISQRLTAPQFEKIKAAF